MTAHGARWVPLPACSRSPQDNREGLELVTRAIEAAGYTGKVEIAMDVAASEFYTADKARMAAGMPPHTHGLWVSLHCHAQKYDLNFKEEGNDGSAKLDGTALKDLYKVRRHRRVPAPRA